MEYEEPTIIDAPGYVGKTTFVDGKGVDPQITKDERFITSEFGPMVLTPGEVLNILDEKEKGELIYIKIVTDNPYASVYLEIDEYKNDQNGETHAELLYDQRKSNAEGQFYVETDGSNGKGYPLVWNPQTNPTAYGKRIKLRVTNPLRRSKKAFGFDLDFTSRGGEPVPIQPLHMAGGSFTHSGLAGASLDTVSKAMANPVGATTGYTVDSVINEAIFNNDGQKLGEGNLYAGLAGKPLFRRDASAMGTSAVHTARGAQYINGQVVLTAEEAGTNNSNATVAITAATNFPGSSGSPSNSTITITGDAFGAVADGISSIAKVAVGDKVFVRNGDTVHFPGTLKSAAVGDGGNVAKLIVEPGLKNAVSGFTMTPGSESTCLGTIVSQADVSPDIVVRKVIVRRKRLVSYEG